MKLAMPSLLRQLFTGISCCSLLLHHDRFGSVTMNVTLFQNNGYVYTEQQRSFYNENSNGLFTTKTATVFLQRKQQRESVGTSLFTYIEMALVR